MSSGNRVTDVALAIEQLIVELIDRNDTWGVSVTTPETRARRLFEARLRLGTTLSRLSLRRPVRRPTAAGVVEIDPGASVTLEHGRMVGITTVTARSTPHVVEDNVVEEGAA